MVFLCLEDLVQLALVMFQVLFSRLTCPRAIVGTYLGLNMKI